MAELYNKKALIVGASGGMGSAVASMLAENGVHCALVGRDKQKLEDIFSVCSSSGNPCFTFSCDISESSEIRKCCEEAIDSLGNLNYLIHCAGNYNKASADECDLEAWDHILDANLRSTYHFARHLLPQINETPGGAVIRINSRDAPYTGIGIQTAQKRAIDGYMEVLFEDVREYGTKVCTINPGFVNTPMVNPERLNPELMMQPDDISQVVQFILSTSTTACPTEITMQPQRSPWKSTDMHI
ncbi:MAG: SDR family oxidoreductase [Paracoccaceae bacterium]